MGPKLQTVIIIPARLASTRLPHKPLVQVGNLPLVVRTARQAMACRGVDAVLVATDAPVVCDACATFGVTAVLTGSSHQSGTDRVWEVAERIGAQRVINLQADEPFVDPHDLDAMVRALNAPQAQVVTMCRPITSYTEFVDPNQVKVVCTPEGRALWFSRAPIPYERDPADASGYPAGALLHLGLYGYTRDALRRFCESPPDPLERLEKLEQLRALSLGLRIDVIFAKTRARGIDTPEDLAWANDQLAGMAPAGLPIFDANPKPPRGTA